MPQNGIHGLVGLATARTLARKVPEPRGPLVLGLLFGSMLPDADLYPACILYLSGHPDLLYAVHRSVTHSILAILAVLGLAKLSDPRNSRRALYIGAVIGMAIHSFLDIFFWFSPIDLFWPLSHIPPTHPLLPVVNLWKDVHLPPVLGRPDLLNNLLTAMEIGSCAVYATFVRSLAGEITGPLRKRILGWERMTWVAAVLAVVLAFILPKATMDIAVMAPLLLLFLPFIWWLTYWCREAICRWAMSRDSAN